MKLRILASRMFPATHSGIDGAERLVSLSQMILQRKRLIDRCYPGAFILNPYILRSIQKLEKLIDKHMLSVGGQRIAMPSLAPAQVWKKTGRWEKMAGDLFKVKDRNNSEFCIAPTHEETVCTLVSSYQQLSYKLLPLLLYQITTKFRDELHPKHGLLRGREFLMKDMYTFDVDIDAAKETYKNVIGAYDRLFSDLGLDVIKASADTGDIGGSHSHEFHIESNVGEDILQTCSKCGQTFNSELLDDGTKRPRHCTDPLCTKTNFQTRKGIEIAHAFLLGTQYSKPLDVMFTDKNSVRQYTYMCCFGIGVTRLVAASLELLSSENETVFPVKIAPYGLIIIPQMKGHKCEETFQLAESLYDSISDGLAGETVLDDRLEFSIGQRLRMAREMGYPFALCVGKKAITDEKLVEVINLYNNETTMVRLEEAVNRCISTIRPLIV